MKMTFSITDEEVIKRLNEQKNKSEYIQNLIKREIEETKSALFTEYDIGLITGFNLISSYIEEIKSKLKEDKAKEN